jgi:hypothetical protein
MISVKSLIVMRATFVQVTKFIDLNELSIATGALVFIFSSFSIHFLVLSDMGRRNQKSSCHRNTLGLQAQRTMPVNVNACHEKQSEVPLSKGVTCLLKSVFFVLRVGVHSLP